MNQQPLILFDWGDTLMRDSGTFSGPMCYWPIVELIEGVQHCLSQLSPNYILGIASNAEDSNSDLLRLALQRLDIDIYFSHIFVSCEMGLEKPNPLFFKRIVDQLKLSRVVMVGNSYVNDIQSAKKAGLKTVFYNRQKESNTWSDADRVVTSMRDVPKAIQELL